MSDERRTDETVTTRGNGLVGWLTIFGKGLAMGAADTVPGVSGGTIALVTGIYERLVEALAALDPRLLGELRGVHQTSGRRRIVRRIRDIDLPFLVVLGFGIVTAILVLSRVVHAALVSVRAPTFAFFFGLIAAAALVLYRQIDVADRLSVTSAIVGFAIAYVISGASSGGTLPHTLPVVFLSGMIAITAMVLPGISGAFILLLLGQYTYLTGVLTRFVDAVIAVGSGGTAVGLIDRGTVVITFGIGAVIGVVTIAHIIRRALHRYRRATLAFLVSLMVGSLRLPVLEIVGEVRTWTVPTAAGVVGAALLGAIAVLALDRYTADLEYASG